MRHVADRAGPSNAGAFGRVAMVSVALLLMAIAGFLGPSARAAGSAEVVSHGSRTKPSIALTFDDGSSPENCRRILAELVVADVPATFFPIAAAMDLDPDFWRLVAAAGDPIGDHTMTHPQMPTLTPDVQLRQLQDSRALIEAMIGRPMLNVFRPPYGAYDGSTLAAAATAGFPTVLTWDTSDRDTSQHGTLAQRLDAAELGTNGSVILMHCGPNATPYLLPDLIAFYRAKGYQLVSVPTLLGIAWDPGQTTVPTAATILGNLAPLPSTWQGGVLVGADGYTAPSPTPTGAAATASASPSPAGSAAETAPASLDASAPPLETPTPSAVGGSGAADGGASVWVAMAVAIAVAGLAAVALVIGVRRRASTRGPGPNGRA